MSGTAQRGRAPAGRGTVALRLPRVQARVDPDVINGAFDLLERADSQNLKAGGRPTLPGVVLLSSPSGIAYQLSVDDDGALNLTQVPR